MILNELLKGIETVETAGDLNVEITGIVYDSRLAAAGSLFVALHGVNADGAAFIEDAVRRGAVAIVSQIPYSTGGSFPFIQVADARLALAQLSVAFYNAPAARLCSVGVTGTNGKTTVSFMLREIFKAAGKRPGLLGTVRYEIGDRVLPAARTTPEAPDIHSMFAQMERAGCDSVVMEVSSHALAQHRTFGIEFDAAVFTNLTQDHLDYHRTLDEYFSVKSQLFTQTKKFAVINADDSYGEKLLADERISAQKISYGFSDGVAVRGSNAVSNDAGSKMHVESPWGAAEVSLKLIGQFNLNNALAAFATAAALGVPVDMIVRALAKMDCVPGRLESIANSKGRKIFVDYAHTDDALRNVLDALRPITHGKLIVVFGCGGNRDAGKRELMGAVASKLADFSIITNDNPRNEIPEKIAADILTGFDSELKYEIIYDRRDAIARGIELTGKKDVLLIAGKGHETYQEFRGTIVPFDDRETVRELV